MKVQICSNKGDTVLRSYHTCIAVSLRRTFYATPAGGEPGRTEPKVVGQATLDMWPANSTAHRFLKPTYALDGWNICLRQL